MPGRLVCWFSCGAASAVATNLAITENRKLAEPRETHVMRCRIDEEHPDNDRFAAACSAWFNHPIEELASYKYGTSIFNVFEKRRYISGVHGAPCTVELKKKLAKAYRRQGDRDVYGFSVEELARIDRLIDANNLIDLWCPLVDSGLTHEDCIAIIRRAGIELPEMYRLGYNHNNCIGCVKAGMGYWNKIRVDFPAAFERMSKLERKLNTAVLHGTGGKLFLDELNPSAGDMSRESEAQCGIFCELAERELA